MGLAPCCLGLRLSSVRTLDDALTCQSKQQEKNFRVELGLRRGDELHVLRPCRPRRPRRPASHAARQDGGPRPPDGALAAAACRACPPSPRSAASSVHHLTHPSPRCVRLQLFAVRDALPFAPPPKKRAPALPYTGTPTDPLRHLALARDTHPSPGSLTRSLRGLAPLRAVVCGTPRLAVNLGLTPPTPPLRPRVHHGQASARMCTTSTSRA